MSLQAPAELNPENWRRAGRALLAKALAEFSYEELLAPIPDGGGWYRLELTGGVGYRFRARRGAYESWHVDPESVQRRWEGREEAAHDPLLFVLDANATLGLEGDTSGHLVRELTATLSADARLAGSGRLDAAELAELSYAELEGYQTGHPWIVFNKGRLGFSAGDAQLYTPEARRSMRLPWIAVQRDLATYRGLADLPAERLYAIELDEQTYARFTYLLSSRGHDPEDYWWLPVHPWQWDEVVVPLFAADVAAGRIVPLCEGPDAYLAQQSLRTFTNLTSPERHSVKLPLSVLNTTTWRGLPPERALAAPAVTAWVQGIAEQDDFLRERCAVVLLGEVASVAVRHPVLEELPGVPYQYRELLGVIWREPLSCKLRTGERARALAALLHVDPQGQAFVAELVDRSGLDARTWLGRLMTAVLPPLLHFLYRYGVVFSPHGENAIVVYDADDVPVRLAVKDFVGDVSVSDTSLPELAGMPAEVASVLPRERPEFLCQVVHAGLFVGHFRYLAELAERQLGVPEAEFWSLVRDTILDHQEQFPELAERFKLFDLLTPQIDRLCLNRNRLLLEGYRDRPVRPSAALYGQVSNPLARGHR